MKLRALLGIFALLLVFVAPAEARKISYAADPGCNIIFPCEGVTTSLRGERVVKAMGGFGVSKPRYSPRAEITHGRSNVAVVAHPSGCPSRAFCGCGTAVRLLGAPVRALWLARAWFKFPRAAPAPGMAAVRNGHVFAIESVLGNGLVMAYDPNSGRHQTRIHVRSLAGYTVVNPRG